MHSAACPPVTGAGWTRPDDASEDELHLSRRTRLVLRLPERRAGDAMTLSGRSLDVAGCRLTPGAGKIVALAPATSDRGLGCTPVTPLPGEIISCTSGTAAYCESGGFVAVDFNRCVDEDGTEIDGRVEAVPNVRGVVPTVSVTFQPIFTIDDNPIIGGFGSLSLTSPTSMTFASFGFSLDALDVTVPSGGLTIVSGIDASGSFPLQLDVNGLGALSGTVTLVSGVLQNTTLQGSEQSFDCTGSLVAGSECSAPEI